MSGTVLGAGDMDEPHRRLSVLVRGGRWPVCKPNKSAIEKKTVRTVALSSPERCGKRLRDIIHQMIYQKQNHFVYIVPGNIEALGIR